MTVGRKSRVVAATRYSTGAVATYKDCRLRIGDCQLASSHRIQLEIGNWKLPIAIGRYRSRTVPSRPLLRSTLKLHHYHCRRLPSLFQTVLPYRLRK